MRCVKEYFMLCYSFSWLTRTTSTALTGLLQRKRITLCAERSVKVLSI
jgi:hypothetical protein